MSSFAPLTPSTKGQPPGSLTRDLDGLERLAGAPLVPGEVDCYARRLAEALARFERTLAEGQRRSRSVLAEIVRVDPALSARVEDMRRRLTQLAAELVRASDELRLLGDLDQRSVGAAPTEAGRGLRQRMLAWIAKRRALERELGTWLQEAHYRDRGFAH